MGTLGALPQTENLTLGQGFSAKARDETVVAGFISHSAPKSSHLNPLHRSEGEIGAWWLMPVSLTPRKLRQKGCYGFEASLVYCVRLGFGSFQNEPPKSVQRNRQEGRNNNSKKPTVNQQEVEEINHGVYTMHNSENRQGT